MQITAMREERSQRRNHPFTISPPEQFEVKGLLLSAVLASGAQTARERDSSARGDVPREPRESECGRSRALLTSREKGRMHAERLCVCVRVVVQLRAPRCRRLSRCPPSSCFFLAHLFGPDIPKATGRVRPLPCAQLQ